MMLNTIIRLTANKHGLCRCARISSSCAPKIAEIREHLKQFPGGSVDLDLDSSSGVAVLTLNHVEKMNALSGQMIVDLADRVTELESWSDGKGVILKGAGKTFCSGGDLSTVQAIFDPVQGNRMCYIMQDTTTRFSNLPMLTFALIQGRALGGGAELTTACDFRLMTTSAKIGFVQSRMGVTPGWGGGTRLVKLVGRTKALSILCSGRVLDTESAKNIGLVDHVLQDSENILDEAKTLICSQYCSTDSSVLRAVKSVVTAACDNNVYGALEHERDIFTTTWGGPHHSAAMNKRVKHD